MMHGQHVLRSFADILVVLATYKELKDPHVEKRLWRAEEAWALRQNTDSLPCPC